MARLKGFVYGKPLKMVKALNAIREGDLVVIREMSSSWHDKHKLDPIAVSTTEKFTYGEPYAVTDVLTDDSCSYEILNGTMIHVDEVQAWMPKKAG